MEKIKKKSKIFRPENTLIKFFEEAPCQEIDLDIERCHDEKINVMKAQKRNF